ncbi:MAG: hypothetical protein E7311_06045 [Clostridiales bacterium]|nr:hypothetical protein [Clostridiales bacterium]
MDILMSKEEKKFISVMATAVIWILLFVSFKVGLDSGMIENAVNRILSSYYLMTMVIQTILATLIMGLGLTSYVAVKQNKAMEKAKQFEKEEIEEKREYIVE